MKTIPKNIVRHIWTGGRQMVTQYRDLYLPCTTAPFIRKLKACIIYIK